MLPQELDKALDRVTWGKRFVRVIDGNGNEKVLILKSLELRDKNWINFIYTDALAKALDNGVLSEKELEKELELRELWGPPQEKELEDLNKELDKMAEAIEEARDTRDRRRFEKALDKIIKKKRTMEAERASRFSHCAERLAETAKMYAIVFSMTYDENEKRFWANWTDFENETDFELIASIIGAINKSRQLSEKEIRQMARAGVWRYMWNAGKNCGDLFGKPIVHLDAEQQALIYWSQIYDSVYEAYERPSDDIINDDEKLDKWFKDQSEKRNKEKENRKKKNSNPFGISDKMKNHGEIFVVVDRNINPNAPSMEEVSKMNSPDIQDWKNRQFNTIKEKGFITEKELRPRGDRESRGLIGSSDAVTAARRTNRGTTRDVVKRVPGGTL